jgi:hypothetical protein
LVGYINLAIVGAQNFAPLHNQTHHPGTNPPAPLNLTSGLKLWIHPCNHPEWIRVIRERIRVIRIFQQANLKIKGMFKTRAYYNVDKFFSRFYRPILYYAKSPTVKVILLKNLPIFCLIKGLFDR